MGHEDRFGDYEKKLKRLDRAIEEKESRIRVLENKMMMMEEKVCVLSNLIEEKVDTLKEIFESKVDGLRDLLETSIAPLKDAVTELKDFKDKMVLLMVGTFISSVAGLIMFIISYLSGRV